MNDLSNIGDFRSLKQHTPDQFNPFILRRNEILEVKQKLHYLLRIVLGEFFLKVHLTVSVDVRDKISQPSTGGVRSFLYINCLKCPNFWFYTPEQPFARLLLNCGAIATL